MFVKVFRSEILADFRRLGIFLVALGAVPGWPVPVRRVFLGLGAVPVSGCVSVEMAIQVWRPYCLV
jgi:hypothetical protein